MFATLPAPFQRLRAAPWWAVGLACALAVGAALRLAWGLDIEYKADEAWTFEHALRLLHGAPWPSLGMPSSVGLPNPGLSLWVFAVLDALFAVQSPPDLARAVQLLNVVALVLLCAVVLRWLPAAEREPWLWAAALAAVNPMAVLFQRKIWPPSVLPLFLVLLLAGWWRRERRGGALLWGLCGALIGQIHLSGFFFAAALAGGTLLRRRTGVVWSRWWAGTLLGAVPLMPWLADVGGALRDGTFGWWRAMEGKFWLQWATEPLGFGLCYSLGDQYQEFLTWPEVAGQPLYLVALLHAVVIGTGVVLLLRALRRGWRGAGGGDTGFCVNWAFWGYGLLLTVMGLRFYRHYLIVAFPLTFVWLAQLALGGRDQGPAARAGGRRLLVVLCVAQALLSACFLHYLHERGTGPESEFGVPYSGQWSVITVEWFMGDE